MATIALAQVDGKWPNLALMKLSAWHKKQGDIVEWFQALKHNEYDRIYASKTFADTPDDLYLPASTIKGGTGYDLSIALPDEIESCFPDYSIYPDIDYAIGFTTRGCIRNCPFCVVPKKEGRLRIVDDITSFWSGQKKIALLDNNLTAAPWNHFEHILGQCIEHKLKVDFSQGLDIRLLTEKHAALLAKVSLWKQIHFAWDRMDDENEVRRGIQLLKEHMPLSRVMFYVLIGYDTNREEDLYRVTTLASLKVDPFVMPFNRKDKYERRFARWVNHKAIFKSVKWSEYKPSKVCVP